MRVLLLDPVGTLGGAERMVLDILASLRTLSPHLATGLFVAGDGALVSEAADLGADVRLLPMPDGWSALGESALSGGVRELAGLAIRSLPDAGALAAYVLRLRRAIEDFNPSLVHTHGMKMHWLAALATPRHIPIVWHMHDLLGQRKIMAGALRAVAFRVNGVLANSRAVGADAQRVLRRARVAVVHNGIDTDTFSPTAPAADLDVLSGGTASGPDILRVGLVATYARWKGHDVFLQAAARVLSTSPPPVRFYIVGGPQYRSAGSQFTEAELRRRVDELGLTDHVAFVPFQRNPECVFRALDVIVHASTLPEPFGRTIVEGMACARAVIAANEGGAAELFESGVDAVGVPPRDPVALANACATLLSDPAMRQRLGLAGRETALKRFSRARMAREILDEYERVAVA